MKNLLSFQERRIVNILYALSVEEDYMTLKDIQKMNQCSDRTVLSDIRQIRDFWGDKIILEHYEHVLFIRNKSMGKLHQYIYDVLNQSLLCNLLVSVFFNPEENMEYHAIESYISTSHALRTLSDVNSFLKDHKMTISKANGKHFIEGNSELNLRYFMGEFLLQYQPIHKSFSSKELMLDLLEILRKAFAHHKIILNELLLNHFNLFFYLSIIREKQGYPLLNSMDQFKSFDFDWKHEELFTKDDVVLGLKQFNDFIFVYSKNKNLENKIKRYLSQWTEKDFIKKVLNNPSSIAESIYIYMISVYCNPTKLEKLLDRSIIFGQESQKLKSKAFEVILKQIHSMDVSMKNFLLEHLNPIIFWVALDLKDYHIVSSKKVLVISDLGKDHADDLKYYLEHFFPHHQFHTEETLHGLSKDPIKDLDHFDLIISTTSLPYDKKVPIIEINDFISQDDLGRVFTALR